MLGVAALTVMLLASANATTNMANSVRVINWARCWRAVCMVCSLFVGSKLSYFSAIDDLRRLLRAADCLPTPLRPIATWQ